MGAYQAATALGLRIPEDVSIVGIDNLEIIADALWPGLTTVALPHYEMGSWAVHRLLDDIENPGAPAVQTQTGLPLIERGSARPAAKLADCRHQAGITTVPPFHCSAARGPHKKGRSRCTGRVPKEPGQSSTPKFSRKIDHHEQAIHPDPRHQCSCGGTCRLPGRLRQGQRLAPSGAPTRSPCGPTTPATRKNSRRLKTSSTTTTRAPAPRPRSRSRRSRRTPTTTRWSRPRPPRSCPASSTSTGRTCPTGPGRATWHRWSSTTDLVQVPAQHAWASGTTRPTPSATTTSRWRCSHAQVRARDRRHPHPDGRRALDQGRVHAALTKLKDPGDWDYPLDIGTGGTGEWWPYAYSPFLQSFGGDLINRDDYQTAEGVLNGAEAVEWATVVPRPRRPGLHGRRRAAPTRPRTSSTTRAAILYTGIWTADEAPAAVGDDLVVLPPPDFGNGPKIGGGSWQWGVDAAAARTPRRPWTTWSSRCAGQVHRRGRRGNGQHPRHRRGGRAGPRLRRGRRRTRIFLRVLAEVRGAAPGDPGLPVHRDRVRARPPRTSSTAPTPRRPWTRRSRTSTPTIKSNDGYYRTEPAAGRDDAANRPASPADCRRRIP